MEEIETIHHYVTDKLESSIVVDKTEWLEPSLTPANANEDEVSMSGSSSGPSCFPESPWPRLNKLFSVHSSHNQNLSFECLLCRLKKNIISMYITSHSNLCKHVQVCYCKLLFVNAIKLRING